MLQHTIKIQIRLILVLITQLKEEKNYYIILHQIKIILLIFVLELHRQDGKMVNLLLIIILEDIVLLIQIKNRN